MSCPSAGVSTTTDPAPEPFTLPVTLAAPPAELPADGPDDDVEAAEAAGGGADFVPHPSEAASTVKRATMR